MPHAVCRRLAAHSFGTDDGPIHSSASDRQAFENELTADKLKEMKANWRQNKTKLASCRKEVKSKGLAGDDRWFYVEDCMGKP